MISAARAGSPAGPGRIAAHAAMHGSDGAVVVGGDLVHGHRGTSPVRRESAGLHDDDLDAERRGLDGEHAAEAVDRELGGLIAGDARGAAHAAANRGELHDGAAALCPQLRDHRLGHVVHAPEIGLELGPKIGLVARLDGCDVRVPRVVDDDVKPAETPGTRRDRGTDRSAVGDIEGERQHAVAVLLRDLGKLSGLARSGDDAVTSVESGADEGAAEAARGAGDEPDLLHEQSRTRLVSLEPLVLSRRLRPAVGERLGSYLREEVAHDAPEQLRLVAGR